MAPKHIGAILTLRDNMTATLRGVRREQSAFRKDVQETRKAMEKAYRKKHDIRINNSSAMKAIKQTRKAMEPFRKTMVLNMAYKDMITAKLRKTKNELKNIGRMVISPVIKVKDFTMGALGRIRSGLSTLALPAGIAAAAGTAAVGASLVSGATLEQQQISMKHFIQKNNKGLSGDKVQQMTNSYLNLMRDDVNTPQFGLENVVAAGSRAVGVTSGNIKDAMELVKVAEDMAALTPGKTIQDAMEGLADAKTGEMERLKEFNAKVSAKEFKKLGFKGVVDKILKAQFEGGAKELSSSGGSLWATIRGKLGTISQNFGLNLLQKLKPGMQSIISLIDKWSPKITEKLNKAVDDGYRYIKSRYTDNKEFQKLTFAGKINFVFNDIESGIEKWLNNGGRAKMQGYGKKIGEFLSSGAKAATPLLAEAAGTLGTAFGSAAVQGIEKAIQGHPLAATLLGSYTGFQVAGPYGAIAGGFAGAIGSIPKAGIAQIPKGAAMDVRNNKTLTSNSFHKGQKLPHNARGTNFWRGGPTWVGEKGPEIVNLPRGAQVVPNNKVSNVSESDRKIEININGYNKSTSEILSEIVPQLKLALANM